MSRSRDLLFGAALTIAFAAPGIARAADDGYENVFSSVATAVGLIPADKSVEIDYRERAPLVLPPKMDLVKPVAEGASRTAAWPQDPDVQRRRRESEEARAPAIPHDIQNDTGRKLTREELMQGRVGGKENKLAVSETARRLSACGQSGNQRGCLVLSPDQMRELDERWKASGQGQAEKTEIVAGEEPDRKYLTQPPKGYMKTTKTVQATAEAPIQKRDESSPMSQIIHKSTPEE